MGDTAIALAIIAYFIVFITVGTMAGFGTGSEDNLGGFESPESPFTTQAVNSTFEEQSSGDAFRECLLTGGAIPIIGIIGYFAEQVFGADIPIVDCTTRSVTRVYQVFTDALDFGLKAATFLFQLLTFQSGLPAILNFLFLSPAFILAFVGVRLIRGVG